MDEKKPKKRGRKPKKKTEGEPVVKKVPKKRGRKPKGGKIIKKKEIVKQKNLKISQPNIILHLQASSKDTNVENSEEFLQSYNINKGKNMPLNYETLDQNNITYEYKEKNNDDSDEEDSNLKHIWTKLLQLKKALHHNQLITKRSACFWCTCPFDNPPIYIPKQKRGESIEVYGSFCSPECGCAYLKKEQIDESTRWERYAMLNNIYGKIYNYEKNIKPAPNPHFTLDKFHGNLSINEYRKLLFDDRLLLVVDKPLTKIVPELYEENNETPFIYGNLLTMESQKKAYRLKRKQATSKKSQILVTNFGLVG
jgi:hypothetical protein